MESSRLHEVGPFTEAVGSFLKILTLRMARSTLGILACASSPVCSPALEAKDTVQLHLAIGNVTGDSADHRTSADVRIGQTVVWMIENIVHI